MNINFEKAKQIYSYEMQQQLKDSVELLKIILGPDLLGVYLYGSSLVGGLQKYSDIDLFVVTNRVTTSEEKTKLIANLLQISGVYMKSSKLPIEMTIVEKAAINPAQYIDGIELIQYSMMNAPKSLPDQEQQDWVTFFKRGHYMSEEQVQQEIKTPEVLEAFKRAKLKSLPDRVREPYEAEDREYDRYSQHTESLVQEGKQEGKVEGAVAALGRFNKERKRNA